MLTLPVFVLAMAHLIPALARQSWADRDASRWLQFVLPVLWFVDESHDRGRRHEPELRLGHQQCFAPEAGRGLAVCRIALLHRRSQEVGLKSGWRSYLAHPRIARFRRRMAPQLRFLRDRLSPTGRLGLHLTMGALIIIAATWCFGGIVEDLLTGDPLTVVDRRVANWFHERATPAVTRVAIMTTFLGSPPFLTGASLATALLLAWRRCWQRLLSFALTMGGGMLLLLMLKALFHRQRPPFESPLMTLTSYSFPSGHVMGSTLFCGSIAFIVASNLKAWRWRVLVFLLGFLFVLLIALTRVYLGVHYLSDVLGAMTAGLAWFVSCVTAVEVYRRGPDKAEGS